MGVREARSGFRFQLVRGEVLGLERQGLGEVALYLGGALAGDPVDEVERDVVKIGITKKIDGAPDVVRTGNTLEHLEQAWLEALGAERDAVHAVAPQERSELGRDGLRIRLDGHLGGVGQPREQTLERHGLGEGRCPAAEEDRLHLGRQELALERELREQRVDVTGMVAAPADRSHEVAVAAAMGAERKVNVEMTCHQSTRSCTTTACDQSRLAKRSWSRSSTGG